MLCPIFSSGQLRTLAPSSESFLNFDLHSDLNSSLSKEYRAKHGRAPLETKLESCLGQEDLLVAAGASVDWGLPHRYGRHYREERTRDTPHILGRVLEPGLLLTPRQRET